MRIIGDIGGTKTYLATIDGDLPLNNLQVFHSQEFKSFDLLLTQYLQTLGHHPITQACFAIAGPVLEGRCMLTNLSWEMDAKTLSSHFSIGEVTLLNDLEAQGYSLQALDAKSITTIYQGKGRGVGNQAVVSPGTGLGEAALFWDGITHRPFATEGGHTDFAPQTPQQLELAAFLFTQFPHLSYERLLSGAGIVHIFDFLCTKRPAAPSVLEQMRTDDPAKVISQAALLKLCPVCDDTLSLFVQILGQEVGNCVLKYMTHGGIYLGGGIPPKIFPKFKEPHFLQGYFHKGRFRSFLEQITVNLITDDQAVLKGAGVKLLRM